MNNKIKSKALLASVPMRPHLLSFLREKEGLSPNEPLMLVSESPAAMYLRSLLENKGAIRDDPRDLVTPGYSEKLFFQCPRENESNLSIFLCPSRVIRFNSFVSKLMMSTLYDLVDVLTDEGVIEKEVIYLFINRFKLYEVNFDTLKKACTRRREKLGKPLLKARRANFFNEIDGGRADISAFSPI